MLSLQIWGSTGVGVVGQILVGGRTKTTPHTTLDLGFEEMTSLPPSDPLLLDLVGADGELAWPVTLSARGPAIAVDRVLPPLRSTTPQTRVNGGMRRVELALVRRNGTSDGGPMRATASSNITVAPMAVVGENSALRQAITS